MVDPGLPGGPPTMLICGNDAEAKVTVSEICEDFGWEAADLGPIERSRTLEEVAMAWVYYGQVRGAWDHAFKLLRKVSRARSPRGSSRGCVCGLGGILAVRVFRRPWD
jgi:hypothetical protein